MTHPTLQTPTHDRQQDHQPSTTTHPPRARHQTSPLKIKKTQNQELHTHASRSDGPPAAGRTDDTS
jgi:hypothetical protein